MHSDLWHLLDALERLVPFDRDAVEAHLGRSADFEIELGEQELVVGFTTAFVVDPADVATRFPDGQMIPPPPPGYGPKDALCAYAANRPWGSLWFKFLSGNRLVQVSLSVGARSSPGV